MLHKGFHVLGWFNHTIPGGFMLGFVVGCTVGSVVTFILMRSLVCKGDRGKTRAQKIDGIWTPREDRPKMSVGPSRTRVRQARVIERTRKAWLE